MIAHSLCGDKPTVRRGWVRPAPDAGWDVARAWAQVEAGLNRVLPASLRRLAAPAGEQEIDAVEAALGVVLPPDFRASLGIHNGFPDLAPAPGGTPGQAVRVDVECGLWDVLARRGRGCSSVTPRTWNGTRPLRMAHAW